MTVVYGMIIEGQENDVLELNPRYMYFYQLDIRTHGDMKGSKWNFLYFIDAIDTWNATLGSLLA